jgi:hypothetical protein
LLTHLNSPVDCLPCASAQGATPVIRTIQNNSPLLGRVFFVFLWSDTTGVEGRAMRGNLSAVLKIFFFLVIPKRAEESCDFSRFTSCTLIPYYPAVARWAKISPRRYALVRLAPSVRRNDKVKSVSLRFFAFVSAKARCAFGTTE